MEIKYFQETVVVQLAYECLQNNIWSSKTDLQRLKGIQEKGLKIAACV